jgi:hypothetical protein
MFKRSSVLQGSFAGTLDDGSVGNRIAERDAEFDDGGARVDSGEDDFARGGEVGIAAGYVGDERWFVVKVKRHEGKLYRPVNSKVDT